MSVDIVSPIFFSSNRVRRSYAGGWMMQQFFDGPSAQAESVDEPFQEEWTVSTVPAVPGDEEGLSRLCGGSGGRGPLLGELLDSQAEALLGAEHVASFGNQLALQCKFFDPSVPMPVEYYPTDAAADEQHAAFACGEAWYILATREIDTIQPAVRIGFKPGADGEAFVAAVKAGDRDGVESMLNRLPVRPGQTYYIPAGMPYAIGADVFMLRFQPPAGPVPIENVPTGLDCAALDGDDLLRRVKMSEHILQRSDEGYCSELVGSMQTGGAFGLWRVEVASRMQLSLPRAFGLVICIGGDGRITWAGGNRQIKAGEYFLQPYGVPWVEYLAHGRLSLLVALPPKT